MKVKARLFCWMIAMAGTALTPVLAPVAQAAALQAAGYRAQLDDGSLLLRAEGTP